MAETIRIEQIRRWASISLASDDFLVETLVLKGGNAIDLLPFNAEGPRSEPMRPHSVKTRFQRKLKPLSFFWFKPGLNNRNQRPNYNNASYSSKYIFLHHFNFSL
jgi:hypothetical protein